MDYFGETSSRNMPQHFFWECVQLDHDTAVRADITKQNYSVCPRHWYVDATFKCSQCGAEFCFTASEQKHWYEDLGFYVDSCAKNCPTCRRNQRRKTALRQTYDREIDTTIQSDDITAKTELVKTIDELVSMDDCLPAKIHDNRKTLARQIARIQQKNGG